MSSMSRLASSSSAASTSSPAQSHDNNPQPSTSKLLPYQLEPPSWRPRLHESSSSLGVPDFFPPFSGQPEDDMSEPTVRSGISSKPVVGNETFSAHDMIYDRLKSGGITALLGNLFTEILSRREELNLDSIQTYEHRLPPRVTLNDFKLNSYIKDLADPTVPLHRLSKSVPHGYRGEKMLDMLWGTNSSSTQSSQTKLSAAINAPRPSVEISRAVWFIRVVGATEIQSARSRPNTNYTAEWTSVVTSWLRKQLNELTVSPSTLSGLHAAQGSYNHQVSSPSVSRGPPTPGRRAMQAGSNSFTSSSSSRDLNPLLDVEHEKRWTSKWAYSISLVRNLLQQSLMDQRVFLRWTTEFLSIANISQLPFILSIAQENSKVYTASTSLSRSLAESICSKLRDLDNAKETERFAARLNEQLRSLLKDLFQSVPEVFVSPRLWRSHRNVLESVLGEEDRKDANPKRRQSDFEMVKSRVDSLLLLDVDVTRNALACSESKIIEILDRVSSSSDLALVAEELLKGSKGSLLDQLDSILAWSCTSLRAGSHRPYAAARLLQIIFERGTISRRDNRSQSSGGDPQQILMRWLGEVDSAFGPDQQSSTENDKERIALFSTMELPSIVSLFGELVRLGLFAFPKYLQRLSARGLTSTSDPSPWRSASTSSRTPSNPTNSIHTRLLRSIPTYYTAAIVQRQRRDAIYGSREKESWEEATERRAIRELHSVFPWLYRSEAADEDMDLDGSAPGGIASREEMMAALPHLWSGSRFIRVKVVSEQLLAPTLARPHLIDAARLALIISVIVDVEDFASLSELVLSLLQVPVDASTLSLLCSVVVEHSTVWTCLGSSPFMIGYLVQLYQISISIESASNEASRTLALTLKSLANLGMLNKEDRNQAAKDQPETPETQQQLYNGDYNQIVAIVNHLLASPQDLENTILSLNQQQSVTISLTQAVFESVLSLEDDSDSSLYVLIRFLDWLCIQSFCSLEIGLKRWTERHLSREGLVNPEESASQTNRICRVLIEMVCKGHLSCQAIIHSMIQPSLTKVLSNVVGSARFTSPHRLLSATFAALKAVLLLQSSSSSPLSLADELRLRASRSEFMHHQAGCPEAIAQVLINLSALDTSTTPQDQDSFPAASMASELLSSISSLSEIKGLVLGQFSSFIICSRNSVKDLWGTDVQSLLNKVIGSFDQTTLLLQPVLELDSEKILNRLHPWRQRQTISELDILTERLHSLDPSLNNRGLAKIAELANLLYQALLSTDRRSTSAQEEILSKLYDQLDDTLGDQLLRNTPSQLLISKLVESSLKDTKASFENGKAGQVSSISPLIRIQRLCSIQPLPVQPSEALTQCFKQVSSHLSDTRNLPPKSSDLSGSKPHPEREESKLLGHLRLLSFLLNLNVAWSQQCKNLFPTILCRLSNLSLSFSVEEEDEEMFRRLIDLIGFAQEQLPLDIQANAISIFTIHLESIIQEFSTSSGSKELGGATGKPFPILKSSLIRMKRLALPSAQSTIFEDLILSRSIRSASTSNFTEAPNKPWNLLEHVEANSSQATSLPSNPNFTGGYISLPISNKSSLPLNSFSAETTGDNLPSPPSDAHEVETLLASYRHNPIPFSSSIEDGTKMEGSNLSYQLPALNPKIGNRLFESERSYGDWKGGEPIYARDARRGLPLVWQCQDEVESRLNEIKEEEERSKEEERKETEKRKVKIEKSKKINKPQSPSNLSNQNGNVSSGPSSAGNKPTSRRPKPKATAGARAAQRLKEEEQRNQDQNQEAEMEVEMAMGDAGRRDGTGGRKRKSRGDGDDDDGDGK